MLPHGSWRQCLPFSKPPAKNPILLIWVLVLYFTVIIRVGNINVNQTNFPSIHIMKHDISGIFWRHNSLCSQLKGYPGTLWQVWPLDSNPLGNKSAIFFLPYISWHSLPTRKPLSYRWLQQNLHLCMPSNACVPVVSCNSLIPFLSVSFTYFLL